MASPSSSPLGSPAADFLTPRTKLARELEAIENAPTPSPKRLKSAEKQRTITAKRASNPFLEDSDGDSSSQPDLASGNRGHGMSDEESVRGATRPRGGAARRMLAAQADGSPSGRLSVGSKAGSSNGKTTDMNDKDELYDATPVGKRLVRRPMASPSPAASVHSQGLFVSPAKSLHDDSDDELPAAPTGSKFAELVAKNRTARLAKEADEKEQKERAALAHVSSDTPGDEIESSQHAPDENAERILSDAVKPTRKASKKALLEMERETQRMSRQMALAHQMKVKRKFTLDDFAKKFQKPVPEATAGDSTSSSAPNSDEIEPVAKEPVSTPPSSPPTPLDRQRALVEHGALSKMKPVREDTLTSLKSMISDDEELPDLAEMLSSASNKREQTATAAPQPTPMKQDLKLKKRDKTTTKPIVLDDSDSDLEIVAPLPRHLRAFDNIRQRPSGSQVSADSKAIHNLKHLSALGAYVSKPGKKGTKPSIAANQLELQLRRKAREQARRQQTERLEELRAKGIVVQTEEEREKEREQFENLLEKARQEAEGLRKAEKAARKEAGERVEASSDEDEDEEYVGSGSEDEDGDEEMGEGLVDEAAEESSEGEEDDDHEAEVLDEAGAAMRQQTSHADEPTQPDHTTTATPAPKRTRKSRVIEDDEDISDLEVEDEMVSHAPVVAATDEDPFAAFGFGNDSNNALMSPAQAFHATMQTPTQDIQQDSMALYRQLPPPSTSSLPPTMPEQTFDDTQENSQTDVVPGSQAEDSQPFQLNWETQAPKTPAPALGRGASGLSETPGWEPTQDPGVQSPWAARQVHRESTHNSIAEDAESYETQSTVRVRISESPIPASGTPDAVAPKRGRLSRRKAIAADESEDEEEVAVPQLTKETVKQSDAFREMARRRAEALTAAERAEASREMKGMLEEQAEESEDEYAGLGGDDFVAPETAEDAAMIDSSEVQVDERALAAHFAERQRVQDEEQTSKLFKDLTTGGLRRRQAGAWDLDEDEDEVAVRRRQMRQREEARKRKLLLQDGDLDGLVKEGSRGSKGKEAFLKAIADDDGDDELAGLSDDGAEEDGGADPDDSQPSQQQDATMPLQETTGNKRRASSPHPSAARPPAAKRRTAAAPSTNPMSRPTSMLQIQDSLSFLLDEPEHATLSGPTVLDISSDSESGSEDEFAAAGGAELDLTLAEAEDAADIAAEHGRSNDGGFAPDRAVESERARAMMPPPRAPASQRRTKAPVVDRLSLRRDASSNNSSTDSVRGKPNAWASTSGANAARTTPSLLRRATTSATSLANDRGVSTSNSALRREGSSAGAGSGAGVPKKGSKKSSLAYQARAEERKGIVEAGARRRREEMERLAGLRREGRAGGLAGGLGGKFE